MLPREDLSDDIIGDEFSFMELSEHPLGECKGDGFQVDIREWGEDTVVPVAVGDDTVKVRVWFDKLTTG